MQNIRNQYVVLLTKFMNFSGYDKLANITDNTAMAKRILAFETELAKVFMDKNDTRNPYKTCNITSIEDWQKMLPVIDIKAYMNAIGLGTIDSVNIGQTDYIKNLNKIIEETDMDVLKAYLACSFTTKVLLI